MTDLTEPGYTSNGDLIYICILLVGVAFSLFATLKEVHKYGFAAIALRPIVPFAIFFSIIHFVTPLFKATEGVYRYQDLYPASIKILTATLSLSLLLFAYILAKSRQFSPETCPPGVGKIPPRSTSRHTALALTLLAIGAGFAIQDAYIIFYKIGYSRFLADIHIVESQRSSLRVFSNLMILGSALYLSSFFSERRGRWAYLTLAIVLTPVISYAIILNSRNTLFILFLTSITVYLGFSSSARPPAGAPKLAVPPLTIRKTTLKRGFNIAAVVCLVVAASVAMSRQRYTQSDHEYLAERRERLMLYALDGAFGNDENVLWLLENGNQDLLLGWTYIAGVLVIIPRALWSGKPHGAGPYLINLIAPGSYIDGAEGNNSLTTGLITEAFMNFGYLGMFASVIAWAYLSSRFIRAFHRSANLFNRTGYLLAALLVSTALLYQEFLGFFGRSFVVVFPLFLLGLLAGTPKSTRYKPGTI